MTYLDKTKTRTLAVESEKALAAVAKKFGLVVRRAGGKFDSANATLKFDFSVVATDGTVTTPEVSDFKRNATRFGFMPTDLGRTFVGNDGLRYKIVGMRSRAHKYPVIGEAFVTGKRLRFMARSVKLID